MLAQIGFFVGLYIILRCLCFITRKGDRQESLGVKIFSWITLIITAFLAIDLLIRGLSGSPK